MLIRGFDMRSAPPWPTPRLSRQHQAARRRDLYAYLYPLQVAAVLLLVAIIAAISLTCGSRKDSRYIDPTEQMKAARPTACASCR